MPAPAPSDGDDVGVHCDCGRFVVYQPCKSDNHGNKGRPVAVVSTISTSLE
jgi:hypothetical protein